MEVSKSDWKLFRACIGDWQEAYMERLVKEYRDLLDGAENASDKFWKLEERIKKDKKHPGVMLELSKENMIFDISYISSFSQEIVTHNLFCRNQTLKCINSNNIILYKIKDILI